MATEIAKQQPTPATLIELALQQNVDVEKLERLMQMQEKWEAAQARKAFFAAMADFQSIVPVITKNKKTAFEGSRGRVEYSYATLDQIIAQIKGALKLNGLSYRWEIGETENLITVTCIVTHVNGHSERTHTSAKADTSGSKNEIQARGSTLTYLQRYTLIGALGIGTAQDDVDGVKSDFPTEAIAGAKTQAELHKVWGNHVDLHKNKKFIQAVSKRKAELEKEGTQ